MDFPIRMNAFQAELGRLAGEIARVFKLDLTHEVRLLFGARCGSRLEARGKGDGKKR
jgi:hypothetical protein